MRRVTQVMGTVLSIDIPACEQEKVFKAVFKRLQEIDESFSPFKSKSEVSLYAEGSIGYSDLSDELKEVIKACRAIEKLSNGYFSMTYKGKFDPSGYVKGWAIAEAAKTIAAAGFRTYCLAIGGDILARSDGSKKWTLGILNPRNQQSVVAKISAKNKAVATSGNYERGKHIFNPKTGRPADFWLSLSVIGSDVIGCDWLATAAFAMDQKAPAFLQTQKGCEFLAIDKEGHIICSPSLAKSLV